MRWFDSMSSGSRPAFSFLTPAILRRDEHRGVAGELHAFLDVLVDEVAREPVRDVRGEPLVLARIEQPERVDLDLLIPPVEALVGLHLRQHGLDTDV